VPATTYTATLKGGAGGVADLSGNALAADVSWIFTTATPPDVTPPSVLSITPTDGALDVTVDTTVTAVFDEALNPATVIAGSFELRDSSGTLVDATLAYDDATRTVSLTPASALVPATTYTATLKGGAGGVADLSGNALAADVVWSFITGAAPASPCLTPCSLWDSSFTPAILEDKDRKAVELGLRFQSDVDGFITAIRFYKGSQNTGVHVGSLWDESGQLLSQAAFSGETVSGWQQVSFPAPVPIQALTTYIASYHTTVGRYSVTEDYFNNANNTLSNGPLRALPSTGNGGNTTNGVYLYGAGGFPVNSFKASNYWVDVVFVSE
jgi:hypothetical protein